MTIVEAVKALAEGKKIRRNDWEKDDYITLIDNKVVSQSGWSSGLCIEDFSRCRLCMRYEFYAETW